MMDGVTPRRASILVFTLLGLVTLAGAALRLREDAGGGPRHSLWLDELHTAWCAAGDFAEIAPRARLGNYSPAYFWMVWLSVKCLGLNEWGVRLPSLLAGISLIPATYFVAARLLGSRPAGLTAAAIVALDGTLFGWYSQEARPYALVQLLAVLHVWVFFELATRGADMPVCQPSRADVPVCQTGAAGQAGKNACPTGRWLRCLWIAMTVALFYLHYTSLLLLCGELAWYAWRRFGPRHATRQRPVNYSLRSLSMDLAIAAAACLPAAPQLWEIFERRENWAEFVPQPTWGDLMALFPIAPWALGLLLAAGCLAIWAERRTSNVQRPTSNEAESTPADFDVGRWTLDVRCSARQTLGLVLCWYVTPLLVAALLTWSEVARVCYPRYLLTISVALPVAAAWIVAVTRRRHVMLGGATAALVVILLTAVSRATMEDAESSTAASEPSFTRHVVEDWRGAVDFVRTHEASGQQPVFLWAGLIEAGELEGERPMSNVERPTSSPARGGSASFEVERWTLDVRRSAAPSLRPSPQGGEGEVAWRRYLLFPICGPYSLDDGRPLVPLTDGTALSAEDAAEVRRAGGAWFIFRSPEALTPEDSNPARGLARQLQQELSAHGVPCRVTDRQAFRGLAVIHLSLR